MTPATWHIQQGARPADHARAHAWREGANRPVCGRSEAYKGHLVDPHSRNVRCGWCLRMLAREAA